MQHLQAAEVRMLACLHTKTPFGKTVAPLSSTTNTIYRACQPSGVMSIEHADFDGIERLALVLGGEISSTFDHPGEVKLGHCKLIEETMIGEDKLIHFQGGFVC
jgi:hypothetical protein